MGAFTLRFALARAIGKDPYAPTGLATGVGVKVAPLLIDIALSDIGNPSAQRTGVGVTFLRQ